MEDKDKIIQELRESAKDLTAQLVASRYETKELKQDYVQIKQENHELRQENM
jgi:hypothetical protein